MTTARPRRAESAATTLDAAAWIDAAFDALAEGGVDAVRVDPLAKRLGVTRGSFYWHFADRAALHTAMLKEWRKRQSYRIGSRIESQTSAPYERLKQTLALPNSSPRAKRAAAIELAIRLWARRDAEAAKAVRHIDRVRMTYYAKLYGEMGLPRAEARKRAFMFYAALMAQAFIVTDADTDVSGDLADMLLDD
ncbi:MAG TPA: TetR/AcrR family transcriptional regulator [Vitreimonas sp.]|uniref:TetR/AcrR family transcriptional regulator n=1 Tax=Vitreimonas sp. TaxID=3069702 RepID=UPI002D38B48D|nr:TetR/AcrR family transcriptional regulator [Vitreimonas sp.]HYD88780.1 TetR/AcrR family transcriptional regulator [Vitreimonas sp.]